MQHIHDYQIISSKDNVIVEVCKECKKKLVTKMDKKGRIDNRVYLKEHSRDTAQPHGATKKIFDKYYGSGINTKT